MKYVKMLGLLAVAAAALMAFAGAASATEVTSETGSTPNIHATSIDTELHGEAFSVGCDHSTVEGNLETHSATGTAKGEIDVLTFTGCDYPVTVKAKGSLEVHKDTKVGAETGDGILTSSGAVITIHGPFGINCEYETNNTEVGTLTGGHDAIIHVDTSAIPRVRDSAFCGNFGEWTGTYTVTHPTTLEVH
ncbi:MAG TPA: hypothetical protein VFY69_09495 [Solirubrobacterales bacterium]|nr:hypothetical protein [Solirubrobacterales bacterium]